MFTILEFLLHIWGVGIVSSVKRLGVALAAISMAGLAGVSPAAASVPTSYCNGKSLQSVVKNYYRGSAPRPLRCGTRTWGFLHITARWNSAFDAGIALTISRGEEVGDLQQDGGSSIYALFDGQCNELFRVIYNGGAWRGTTTVSPQGIITAYDKSSVITTTPERAVDAAAITYRTDCPVYQNI
ncbi:MAG TPA: hypothetical protein VI248_26875 [Kineosporiaceae bacterium]